MRWAWNICAYRYFNFVLWAMLMFIDHINYPYNSTFSLQRCITYKISHEQLKYSKNHFSLILNIRSIKVLSDDVDEDKQSLGEWNARIFSKHEIYGFLIIKCIQFILILSVHSRSQFEVCLKSSFFLKIVILLGHKQLLWTSLFVLCLKLMFWLTGCFKSV